MFMTKLKMTVAVLLGVGLLLVPVTLATRASWPVEQNGQTKAEVRDNDVPGANDREARVQAAQKVYEGVVRRRRETRNSRHPNRCTNGPDVGWRPSKLSTTRGRIASRLLKTISKP